MLATESLDDYDNDSVTTVTTTTNAGGTYLYSAFFKLITNRLQHSTLHTLESLLQ